MPASAPYTVPYEENRDTNTLNRNFRISISVDARSAPARLSRK